MIATAGGTARVCILGLRACASSDCFRVHSRSGRSDTVGARWGRIVPFGMETTP